MLPAQLIIFIKYPQAGLVKTRLAKNIGASKAAFLYRLFVEALLKRTEDKSFQRTIFYSPAGKKKEIVRWLGKDVKIYPQKGRHLGERLARAFKLAFKNSAGRVVAIGSDSPTLDKGVLLRAFKKLKNTQCVLGPALDGGYYLIGLSFFDERIFKGISWGTKNVFSRTINKLKQLKAGCELLGEALDVDSYQDMILLREKLPEACRINPLGLEQILCYIRQLDKPNAYRYIKERR